MKLHLLSLFAVLVAFTGLQAFGGDVVGGVGRGIGRMGATVTRPLTGRGYDRSMESTTSQRYMPEDVGNGLSVDPNGTYYNFVGDWRSETPKDFGNFLGDGPAGY